MGYPSCRGTLRKWYRNYLEFGLASNEITTRKSRYSKDQINAVLKHYFETGENISIAIRTFGYPSRHTLKKWIKIYYPDKEKTCAYVYNDIKYNKVEKRDAV